MGFDTVFGFGHLVCEGSLRTKGKYTVGYANLRPKLGWNQEPVWRMRKELYNLHWHSRTVARERARENRDMNQDSMGPWEKSRE